MMMSSVSICVRNVARGWSRGRPSPLTFAVRNIARCPSLSGVKSMQILMPALSPTMEEGTIQKWLKTEGEQVLAGDALCEIETDKAVVTMEADEDGMMAKILMPEGSKGVKISKLIALMVEDGEDYTQVEIPPEDGGVHVNPDITPAPNTSHPAAAEPVGVYHYTGTISLSPSVRLLVVKHRIQPEDILATGPHGRLIKGDVLKFIKSGMERKPPQPVPVLHQMKALPMEKEPLTSTAQPPEGRDKGIHCYQNHTDIELSSMRKTIAKRLTLSKSTIPHTYGTVDCDMDRLIKIREQLKLDGINVSVNDFIIKAAATTLKQVPELNAIWQDDGPRLLNDVDICVAVATENGLITPIIHQADRKGLSDISTTIRDLATKARNGSLQPHEYQGGSFTISNLGMYGIVEFSTIINPPQGSILAVGGIQKIIDASTISPVNKMRVTLSCDARIADAKQTSEFLANFRRNIENPTQTSLI